MPTPTFTQLNPQDEFQQRALARFQGTPMPQPSPTFQDTAGSGEQLTGAMASLAQPAMPVPGAVPEPFFDPNKLEIDTPEIPLNPDNLAAMAQGKEMANALTGDKTELLPAKAGKAPAKPEPLPATSGKPPAEVQPLQAGAQDPNYLNSKNLGDAAVEQYGVAAGDYAKARAIEQNLNGDNMHWDTNTQKMEPGGNGELDEAEIAAHVADVTASWKEGEAKIATDTAAKLKANLEKLQANQEDLQLRYHQAIDDVANTFINPAELYDKGGFGAQIGMAGSAFLDTWFAMKGFNVPSFSAQWDRAIEQNINAQKSKLEAKNAKVTGFAKLWEMAGQLASTEEEQIAATKDMMKANLLGQYIAQMKPFDSLQASRDKQALAAKAAREMGRTAQEWGQRLADNAQKAAQLEIQRAEYEHKVAQDALKNKTLAQVSSRGASVGGVKASAGDINKSYQALINLDPTTVPPGALDGVVETFGQMGNDDQALIVNHLLGGHNEKNTAYKPILGLKNGQKAVIGFYNPKAEIDDTKKKSLDKMAGFVEAADTLSEINEAVSEVIAEASTNPDAVKSFASGAVDTWWSGVINGGAPLTAKQKNLQRLISAEALARLHDLSGGAVTADEGVRFKQFLPTSAFDKAGRLIPGVSSAMQILGTIAEKKLNSIGTGTDSVYMVGDPTGPAQALVDRLASKMKRGRVIKTDISLNKTKAEGLDAPPAESDATSSLEPSDSYITTQGIAGRALKAQRDAGIIPAPKTASEKSPMVMPSKLKKAAASYFSGEPIDERDQKALERHGETVAAVLRKQEEAHTGNLGDITRGTAQEIRDLAPSVVGNDQQGALMLVTAQRLDGLAAKFDALKSDGLKDTNPEIYHAKLAQEIAEVKKSVDAALKFKVKTKAPPQTPEEIDAAYKAAVEKKKAKANADIGSPEWFKLED